MSLGSYTSEELFQELASRDLTRELVDANGRVPSSVYTTMTKLASLTFIDSFAVRKEGDQLQAGVILRGTGPYPGKLCFVGGIQGQDRRFSDALKYHWSADLGVDVTLVSGTEQYSPLAVGENIRRPHALEEMVHPGQVYDPGKNGSSLIFAVVISPGQTIKTGEKTHDSGQEAAGFYWIDPMTTESASWGYPGMYDNFLHAWRKLTLGLKKGEFRL